MASLAFPLTVAQKQLILFVKPLPPQELSAWGRKYQDAGRFHDALEFYGAAGDRPAVEALAAKAVDCADLVLLLNACRALGPEPQPSQVEALRQRALDAGMESVAKRATTFLATLA